MAVNNGLITYPIGVGEVCNVLGTNHADVGWVCSRSTLIDKFAKYKPVVYAMIDTTPQLNNDKTWNDSYNVGGNKPWWRATDGKCGLVINIRNSGSTLIDGWSSDWAYVVPTGGASAPYRLIDFNHYEHLPSYNPVSVTIGAQWDSVNNRYVYYANSGSTIGFTVHFSCKSDKPKQLKITDFKNSGLGGIWSASDKLYCGVLIKYSSSYAYITNQNAIGESMQASDEGSGEWERTVTFPTTMLPTQGSDSVPIMVYPYICATRDYHSTSLSTTNPTWEKGVISVPVDITDFKIYVQSTSVTGSLVSVTCTRSGLGAYKVSYVYRIKNNTSSSFSFSGRAVTFLTSNDIDTTGTYEGETYDGRPVITNKISGSSFGFTVSGNSTTDVLLTSMFSPSQLDTNNNLVFSAEVNTYTPVRIILQLDGTGIHDHPNLGTATYQIDVT